MYIIFKLDLYYSLFLYFLSVNMSLGSFWDEFGILAVAFCHSTHNVGDPRAGPGRSIRPAKKFALSTYHSGFQCWNRSRGRPGRNSPRNTRKQRSRTHQKTSLDTWESYYDRRRRLPKCGFASEVCFNDFMWL